MSSCVGIDVSKARLDAALLIDGKVRRSKVFANDAAGFAGLLSWLTEHAQANPHVCLEATGAYSEAVATFLYDHAVRVSVVNPLRVKRYGQSKLRRIKTDRADARLIAEFCASEAPEPWQAPAASLRALQALVLRLDALLGMERAEMNRLQTAHPAVQASLQEVLKALRANIEQLRVQIRQTIDDDPDLKQRSQLLDSIPGLGDRTIAQLLAYIGEPARFGSVKALAAYVGLSPAPRQSGSSLNTTRGTSVHGHRALKQALYFPAMVAGRCNPVIRSFWQHLKRQGKPGLVIVVACMHKLLAIIYGVLRSGRPFDPRARSA